MAKEGEGEKTEGAEGSTEVSSKDQQAVEERGDEKGKAGNAEEKEGKKDATEEAEAVEHKDVS